MTLLDKLLNRNSGDCECGCPGRWWDHAGGGPYCLECHSPASQMMVARREYLFPEGWGAEDAEALEEAEPTAAELAAQRCRVAHWRRLFPDLDGDPGRYCTYCLGRELEFTSRRWVCVKCKSFVRWALT